MYECYRHGVKCKCIYMHFKYFSKVFAFDVFKKKSNTFQIHFANSIYSASDQICCFVIQVINVMYQSTQFNLDFYKYFYKTNKLKIFYLIDLLSITNIIDMPLKIFS